MPSIWIFNFSTLLRASGEQIFLFVYILQQIMFYRGSSSVLHRKGELGNNSIFILADTTDAGPDQASRRRSMQACLAEIQNIFYLSQNCFMHQYHLIVRESLVETDAFLAAVKEKFEKVSNGYQGYCSSLCKCVYFWRSNVSEFIDKFESIHGIAKETEHLRRYPLAFISNRWGSIETTELFFLERGRAVLEPVFLAVLSRFMKADKKQAPAAPAANSAAVLMDTEDDIQSYRLKLSKWANGAFCAIRNSLFWCLLRIVNTAREPLSKFYLFLKKYCNDRLLFRLTIGKGQHYMDQFSNLLETHEQWVSNAIKEANANDLPDEIKTMLQTFAFKLVMAAAGSFETRIMTTLRRPDQEKI